MSESEIRPGMDGDEKIKRVIAIVDRELLPALERYYGRRLSERERRIVHGHSAMLFMDPCPLEEMSEHDDKFAARMLARVRLDSRRN